jgi:hypothetical protein
MSEEPQLQLPPAKRVCRRDDDASGRPLSFADLVSDVVTVVAREHLDDDGRFVLLFVNRATHAAAAPLAPMLVTAAAAAALRGHWAVLEWLQRTGFFETLTLSSDDVLPLAKRAHAALLLARAGWGRLIDDPRPASKFARLCDLLARHGIDTPHPWPSPIDMLTRLFTTMREHRAALSVFDLVHALNLLANNRNVFLDHFGYDRVLLAVLRAGYEPGLLYLVPKMEVDEFVDHALEFCTAAVECTANPYMLGALRCALVHYDEEDGPDTYDQMEAIAVPVLVDRILRGTLPINALQSASVTQPTLACMSQCLLALPDTERRKAASRARALLNDEVVQTTPLDTPKTLAVAVQFWALTYHAGLWARLAELEPLKVHAAALTLDDDLTLDAWAYLHDTLPTAYPARGEAWWLATTRARHAHWLATAPISRFTGAEFRLANAAAVRMGGLPPRPSQLLNPWALRRGAATSAAAAVHSYALRCRATAPDYYEPTQHPLFIAAIQNHGGLVAVLSTLDTSRSSA